MGNCKDCKHWREIKPGDDTSHACHRDEEEGCLFDADGLLTTDPMFGCVQFEAEPLRSQLPDLSTDHIHKTYGGIARSFVERERLDGRVPSPFGSRKP